MRTLVLTICLALLVVSSGCSNAGPFVTDISSDGAGGLIITKNTVVFDAFFGVVKDGDKPIVYTIKVK